MASDSRWHERDHASGSMDSSRMDSITSMLALAHLVKFIASVALRFRATAALLVLVLIGMPLVGNVLTHADHAYGSPSDERSASVLANNAPRFAQSLPMLIYPTTDIAIDLAIKVADSDNNTLNVTWEWGDGSPNALNSTDPAFTPLWVNQTHTWSVPREPGYGDVYYDPPFLLNITLDDGNGGTKRSQSYVYVYIPPNGYPNVSLTAPAKCDPNDTALIVTNASDPEGDPLTWTLVLNNSVSDLYTEVFYTPATSPNATAWYNFTYVFGTEGNYIVRVFVSDALPPNQIFPHNISSSRQILVETNTAPQAGTIETRPQSLIINSTIGYLLVNYSIEVGDLNGDPVTLLWHFGDGTPDETNTSASGAKTTFIQWRNYSDAAEFNVTVTIGDGRPGHNVSVSRFVKIESTNRPPSVVDLDFNYSENRSYALPNETIVIEVLIADPEMDPVEVTIDFGDNSTMEYYNLTAFVGGNATLVLNHSYESPGEYNITIRYTDNRIGYYQHSKQYNITVTVKEPPIVVHDYWTTWDYVSLSLFICALLIPVLWALSGRGREEDW